MAKDYMVSFRRSVCVVVPDNASKEEIITKAVEIANEADLDDMYFVEDDFLEMFFQGNVDC